MLDFIVLEVVDYSRAGSFEWDSKDPLSMLETVRMLCGNEPEERMKSREPDVSSGGTVFSFNFQVDEKILNLPGAQILQIQRRGRAIFVRGEKSQQ